MIKPVLFVGSSGEHVHVVHDLRDELNEVARVLCWDDPLVFRLGGTLLPSLMNLIPMIDAAVMVLTPDDRVRQRVALGDTPEQACPRDNLILELGLWLGSLGRDRAIYVYPRDAQLAMPTDLNGVLGIAIPTADPNLPGYRDGIRSAAGRIGHWLTNEITSVSPEVQWPPPAVTGEGFHTGPRGTAERSILLLGNTLFQVEAGFLPNLVAWLNASPERVCGMLFLNPHGPHALGRTRELLHQGDPRRGLEAFRNIIKNPAHPRLLAFAYDGPYRYSARALDIGSEHTSQASAVRLLHSTHQDGISRGFMIDVPHHRSPGCYRYFESDLLNLWCSAQANPTGHGITTVAYGSPVDIPQAELAADLRAAAEVAGRRAVNLLRYEHPARVFLYPPRQHHLTLMSLRRTTSRWAGPLSLSDDDPELRLPEPFPEWVLLTLARFAEIFTGGEQVFRATHLRLTTEGLLCLHDPLVMPTWAEGVNRVIADQADLLKRSGIEPRHLQALLPKHPDFWPHISVGMVFHNELGLPVTLMHRLSDPLDVPLDRPVEMRIDRVGVVHYAYRSFLRAVGELHGLADSPAARSREEVVARLGLR